MILDWIFNNDFIVENYCENKDVEEFACKGSCHLNKQITKAEEPSSPKESNIPSIFELESNFNLNFESILALYSNLDIKSVKNTFNQALGNQSVYQDIFHPPRA